MVPADGRKLKIVNLANENYLRATHAPLGGLTGILAQLVDYIVSTAIKPQPALAAGASLCALGALMGKRYQTETGLRPNLYLIGVSPPNSGKTHVLEALNDLFVCAGLQDYLSTPITRKTQLDKELMRRPCLLWQYDDCGQFLQKASQMPVLVHELSRLFKGDGWYETTAKKGRYHVIQQTCLCLSGMTTPEHIRDAINKRSFLDSVIAGKTLIMPSCGGHEASQYGVLGSSRKALIYGLREVASGTPGRCYSRERISEPLAVACTPEARAVFFDYWDICWQLVEDGGNGRIIHRLAEQAAKIALILAVSDCPSQPLINVRHMRWAIDVVNVSTWWQFEVRPDKTCGKTGARAERD